MCDSVVAIDVQWYPIGGMLSSYLYNAYTGDFSAVLHDTGTGPHIHDNCVNSFSYAGNSILLALTTDILQVLISVCEVYAAKQDIIYNTSKTMHGGTTCTIFKVTYMAPARHSGCALTLVNRFTCHQPEND